MALLAADTKEKQDLLLETHPSLLTEELAKALFAEGERLRGLGEFKKALEAYDITHRASEELNYQEMMARALDMSGHVFSQLDDNAKAREYLSRSLEIAEALNDSRLIANVYSNLGLIFTDEWDLEKALEYFKKSLELRELVGDPIAIASSLSNQGNTYYSLGEYLLALEGYKKAETIFEKADDRWKLSTVLNNEGAIYNALGNYKLSLKCLQRSMELRQTLNNKPGIATTYRNLATIYHEHANYDLALEYYRRSLQLNKELGVKKKEALAIHEIGVVYLDTAKYDLAMELFSQSLKIREEIQDREGIGDTLNAMGEVYLKQDKLELAQQCFNKSLAVRKEMPDREGMAEALLSLANISFRQANYKKASEFVEESKAILVLIGNRNLLQRAQTRAGMIHFKLQQFPEALASFEEAIALVEESRMEAIGGAEEQKGFLDNKLSPYHGATIVRIEQKKNAEALLYAERARARVLLDVLQGSGIDVTEAMNQEERKEQRKWKMQLEKLNTQIVSEKVKSQVDSAVLKNMNSKLQRTRLEYDAFRTKVYSAHPALKTQRGETEPLKLQEVKGLLGGDETALLEYLVTEEKTYGFVVTNSSTALPVVHVFPVRIERDELLEKINSFQKQIGSRGLLYREASRRLYDLLIAPAVALLKKETNLILSPDDVLWNLPFQVLLSDKEKYLLEDYALSYVPSMTVLHEMSKHRNKNTKADEKLLAFGNPAFGKEAENQVKALYRDSSFNPLPEAEKEVTMLAELYGKDHSQIYVGVEAREERIKSKSQNFQIIHLATHGIIDNTSPLYSHLLLAQSSSQEDGLLEAREIMNLNLNADLAVLSACETARGKVAAGEGVIGLSWAFFVAGVPTTVVSQWKVDSSSTTDLMLEFHRNLTQKKMSPAKALQQAELKLLRTGQFSHPFYWSAFVVVGNGFNRENENDLL